MTAVQIADQKSRYRAYGFLFLAVLTTGVLVLVRSGWRADFAQGLWLGLLVGCAFNLLPIKRWLRPNNAVVRLLDDEGTRENRRFACTIGFWAAVGTALLLGFVSHFDSAIAGDELAQVVATAGIAAAMFAFAILELRAAR